LTLHHCRPLGADAAQDRNRVTLRWRSASIDNLCLELSSVAYSGIPVVPFLPMGTLERERLKAQEQRAKAVEKLAGVRAALHVRLSPQALLVAASGGVDNVVAEAGFEPALEQPYLYAQLVDSAQPRRRGAYTVLIIRAIQEYGRI
jgi:hypothetical protein